MVDLSFRFDLWWKRLPASPKDAGKISLLIVRPGEPGEGRRETPDAIEADPERGVIGDRWVTDPDRRLTNQVSLMNSNVLRSLAGDDRAKQALAGDNIIADLDLSEANLPVGSRLAVGDVVFEITPDPHRPCSSFVERFGASAAKKVARAGRKGRRGRGVLMQIVAGGRVRVGDTLRVVSRPS
ncbi:MAG: MOSC domain-containing protein [Planctomycetes bacterium]|nr:MOSC domain-containing protein [Planctomycetota bacterium]MCB9902788.1 MOSC domain-containing protein [Planctomycetota bacterium]